MMTLQLFLPDSDATERFGRALAATRPAQAVVHLHGDLGAGKSTLARALLRALGVQGAIRSPTYTLLERYPLADGEAWHLDLYRIGTSGELDFLGLDEASANLWLVEWPERGGDVLAPADLHVLLALHDGGRMAQVRAGTAAGKVWLTRIVEQGDLRQLFLS
ncbi:tRNA (adenosine(37)-N6)-threonylcarbamoyltransferase complex ATPase subunit type 1 TsaE [Xanthomonas sp. MUS 060]|uniref:tRNA (adenosine(37)-N6)-threonylcarbamoyltransferase complex ATPase subunit type 1 TsaE n=1 Tax=Xanthomonas sp. MUS 060 TaxID=1588031 RepID=UPI0005F2F5E2|nr:tRNA (adenosine(37)-N6)-threonylcarbamoyltransferase complex ATPase subunit type 1 TsaE [Xanthomonas sp. MUS 060]